MQSLVDSHCHLGFPDLGPQSDEVVERARRSGIVRIVNISTSMKEFEAVKAMSNRYDDVFCSVGVHPHVADEPIEVADLIAASKDPKVVCIGETGFDFFYNHAQREDQEACFRKHIRACLATDLPLVVHTRNAEEDTIRVLKEETAGQPTKLRGVIHCYSSKRILAEEALALGFYISLSGMLTFKKSQDIRDIVKDLPMDRLLVETDSPYLAPQSHRGKPCEPAFVAETARVLAEVKGVSPDIMAEQTTRNFFSLFTKVTPL